MYLIDSHAHIYLPEFDEKRDQLIENAKATGVQEIFMPAIDSSTHEKMLAAEEQYPSCISMMGLHPCSVKDDFGKELQIIEAYFSERNFIAVGEIGLDFYWDVSFKDQQYKAFHHQIELALKYNVPIVIHSRNAVNECIEVVSRYPTLRGVFHCFSGNEEQARKIIDLNFLLGIGGVVTFKNSGLDTVIKQVGIEHVILETDAPYLAPVPFRGKRNEPSYLKLVAEKLATITEIGIEQIAQLTTANVNKLFKQKEQA